MLAAMLLAVLPMLWACGESSTTAPDAAGGPQPDDLAIGDVVFTTIDSVSVAWSHHDHWHGALRVRRGEARDLLVFFVPRSQSSHDAPGPADWFTLDAHPQYRIHIAAEDPSLLRWTGPAHVGVLIGAFPGTTRVVVRVRRNNRVVFEAPPVPVVIVDE